MDSAGIPGSTGGYHAVMFGRLIDITMWIMCCTDLGQLTVGVIAGVQASS